MQVINVQLGGTLWQDLPSQLPGTLLHDLDHPKDALVHGVEELDPATRTGLILGRELALVNSRHHQGVKALAPGLVVAGRSPDGLAEAVERAGGGWWLRAVQWHPENLIALDQQCELWREFLGAVGAFDGAGPGNGSGR